MKKLNLIAWIFFTIACSPLLSDCASKIAVDHQQQPQRCEPLFVENDEHPKNIFLTIKDSKNGVEAETRLTTSYKVHEDTLWNIRKGRAMRGGGSGAAIIRRKPRLAKNASASSSAHLSELLGGLAMIGLELVIIFF